MNAAEEPSYLAFARANVREDRPSSASVVRGLIIRIDRDASELKAAQPRTITTAAELDALGFQSVVLDSYGTPYVCERHRIDGTRNEWKPAGMSHLDESDTILYHGPATVIHEPPAA